MRKVDERDEIAFPKQRISTATAEIFIERHFHGASRNVPNETGLFGTWLESMKRVVR
jgi:hypothetical protein